MKYDHHPPPALDRQHLPLVKRTHRPEPEKPGKTVHGQIIPYLRHGKPLEPFTSYPYPAPLEPVRPSAFHLESKETFVLSFGLDYICCRKNFDMKGLNYLPVLIENLKTTRPEKIILFGSYAYGTPAFDSDLDILVVTDDDFIPSSFSEKSKIYLRISQSISEIKKEFPVDLIVHTKAMHQRFIEINSLFARELLSKGILLYEKNN